MDATFAGLALTGPTIPETLSSWDMPTRAVVDVLLPVRGPHARPIPMGNRATEVTLRFRRDQGTYNQAAAFAGRLAQTLPDQGQLVLQELSGPSYVLFVFPDACFAECIPKRQGIAAVVELRFTTGQPPAVADADYPVDPDTEDPIAVATWDTWRAAHVENLTTRIINEPQFVS